MIFYFQGFTEPLEEVTKPTEDDEHDPEYNILADDEINHVDNEDFRIDKAVKITKKEVSMYRASKIRWFFLWGGFPIL